MKNQNFTVEISPETGYVNSIVINSDEYGMNWRMEYYDWGKIRTELDANTTDYHKEAGKNLPLEHLGTEISETSSVSRYKNLKLDITVERFFKENGSFAERVTAKNISPSVYTFGRDTFGIQLPFNDRYTDADDCMIRRCCAQIWCGGNVSWVNALKFGGMSETNLGLFLTKGAFASYSQDGKKGRGCFTFEPETVLLKQGEEYVLEWEIFTHKGQKDFERKLASYQNHIGVCAKHFTVFNGEDIEFDITPANGAEPGVTLDGEKICGAWNGKSYSVRYTPKRNGEHKFLIDCAGVRTRAEFMVKIPFAELVRRRVHFIVDRQQCLDKESPLYGAYLIYDNKADSPYFDFFNTDHNACRERLNMPLVIIRYLQLCEDEKVRRSLDLFIEFMFREFYEESTGEVFNNIGKTRDALRLYNAPGVCLVFAEMYILTKEDRYLDNIVRLCETYYSIGGEKCYSNAVAVRKVMTAFDMAGEARKADRDRVLAFFGKHADNIITIGSSYPKHEVNYEQTIVTPAVTIVSEMGLYAEDKERYAESSEGHIANLDRFVMHAPSYHLNEISVRFWDGFWFGKARVTGDTLPHHLSCLTARSFAAYYRLTGRKEYIERADECIRNCLCLIDDNGRGHAAYLYPHTVQGRDGEFYDEWANDQDLPLYDGMNVCDMVEEFCL